MSVVPASAYVHHVCAWCPGGQKRKSDPWNHSYRLLWASLWALGTEKLGLYKNKVSSSWAISPAPKEKEIWDFEDLICQGSHSQEVPAQELAY